MDVFSVIVIIFLGMLVFAFSVSLFLAIIFNVKAGIKYREPLAKKLHMLRLSKMLSALGISTFEYLHTESLVTINEQMDRCSECTNTDECDDNLSSNIDINHIDFCNNESSLKNMLSKKRALE
jgi:hypothetical protein